MDANKKNKVLTENWQNGIGHNEIERKRRRKRRKNQDKINLKEQRRRKKVQRCRGRKNGIKIE